MNINKASDHQAPEARAEAEDDRRKHRRVDLPLKARFLTDKGDERVGEVLNISAGGAMIRAKFPPSIGQKLVLYIDRVGRVEAQVVRSSNNTFAVAYSKKRAKQAKLADLLTDILNNRDTDADRRISPRIRKDAPAKVYLEDGRELECAIHDISLTGASLEISPRPPLGMHLILGRMTAKVVRRHETGVGVVFTGSAETTENAAADTPAVEALDEPGSKLARTFGKKGA